MPNRWSELNPDMEHNDFEVYEYSGKAFDMSNFHAHNHYEILVILQGNVVHYTEGNVVEHSAGDVCVYPPGVFHRSMPSREYGAEALYSRLLIYLSPVFVHSLDHGALSFSSLLDYFGHPATSYLSFPREEAKLLCQPLREMIRADKDDEPLCHFANRAHMMIFLSQIAEAILRTGSVIRKPEEHGLVPQVLSYINSHLAQNLTLDHLAKQFFINKYYLSHQFKQYTDLSVHQYVLTRRMLHAQSLLRAGYTPSSVASACGYREYSSFYKAFLSATGKPPRDFAFTSEEAASEPVLTME